MREATQELIWMNQKEEDEISRDWSDKSLDLVELEDYRQVSQEIHYIIIENAVCSWQDFVFFCNLCFYKETTFYPCSDSYSIK